MERYNLAITTKLIYASNFYLFTLKTLRDILEIKTESALFSVIKKLKQANIIEKIERNKYLLAGAKINDFALANFLYRPSYISFESALNFYGILSQFPYEVSSATSKKPVKQSAQNKIFVYTHIKKNLFWGYEKKENFIIALPEKALLDQIYLAANGYKKINLDEYNLSKISSLKLKKYLPKYPKTKQFVSALREFKKYIRL